MWTGWRSEVSAPQEYKGPYPTPSRSSLLSIAPAIIRPSKESLMSSHFTTGLLQVLKSWRFLTLMPQASAHQLYPAYLLLLVQLAGGKVRAMRWTKSEATMECSTATYPLFLPKWVRAFSLMAPVHWWS